MAEYKDFLQSKIIKQPFWGKEIDPTNIHPMLFDFQRDVTTWAIRKGRAAVFLDTGLGKTFIQLEWARLLGEKTLIIAPLSVARQTVREALKLGLVVDYVRNQEQVTGQMSITNYEMIDHFDFDQFGAVVLDESSILKAIGGKTRRTLTKLCQDVPYRLCCTATPAPNDYTELGNHVEFLGICKASEMLAMFFINANKEHTYHIDGQTYRRKGSNKGGQEWRIKHHAEAAFFRWLASWAIALIKPSDLGYDDDGFILPALNLHPEFVQAEYTPEDQLFFTHIKGVKHASEIRHRTAPERLEILQSLIADSEPDEQWIVWCGLNDESAMVYDAFKDRAVEVKGSDDPEWKAHHFEAFQNGKFQVLVTKPRIGGFGMNFQNAHKMAFFGLNYSWEQFYQCIRRELRYMQTHDVDVHIIMSDVEASIYHDVMRKDAMARRLREKLIEQVQAYEKGELTMQQVDQNGYQENTVRGENWMAMLGDSCERMAELQDNSIDLSVYSPPFADLYTYTDSERDLGNSRDWDEFFDHYAFIIREVLRVTKPGRLTCVHVSDIPAMAQKDGYIGVKDFPGAVIQAYEAEGWTFVGRAFVQKNPQAQAIRTKSKALLFVQLRKDSADSRPALVDQILLFKKPGENAVPVTPVENEEMDNETWIEWAHGIWTGISETDTLQYHEARGNNDEKHICPLQLGTIERCIKLYSNPGETVLTPFGGIGSEGYQAVKFGRKAVLIELKPEYFDILVKNLRGIEAQASLPNLFQWAELQRA
jgi:DNA modification methylase